MDTNFLICKPWVESNCCVLKLYKPSNFDWNPTRTVCVVVGVEVCSIVEVGVGDDDDVMVVGCWCLGLSLFFLDYSLSLSLAMLQVAVAAVVAAAAAGAPAGMWEARRRVFVCVWLCVCVRERERECLSLKGDGCCWWLSDRVMMMRNSHMNTQQTNKHQAATSSCSYHRAKKREWKKSIEKDSLGPPRARLLNGIRWRSHSFVRSFVRSFVCLFYGSFQC